MHVRNLRDLARALLSTFMAALVGACGGGGGGGDGLEPAAEIAVSLAATPSLKKTLFEGARLQVPPLEIHAIGNVMNLKGKTLYIIVEDPSSLFENPPQVSLSTTPPAAYVSLAGRVLDVPGHYEGNLRIHVCLDSGCNRELVNSPLAIPYEVTVQRGITLSEQAIDVVVPFGQVPPVRTVSVTLPPLPASWGAVDATPAADSIVRPFLTVSTSADDGSSNRVVTLALDPAPPGTYTRLARVYASLLAPGEFAPDQFERTVTVTYTVTPDPSVDAVFAPAAANLTAVQGSPGLVTADRVLATNTGVTATWRGVEYLSHPATANGHPQVNGWWSEQSGSASYGASTCYLGDCLPAGTYTARVWYTLTKEGLDRDIAWPITLQIVPQ